MKRFALLFGCWMLVFGASAALAADGVGKSSDIRDQTTGNGVFFKLHDETGGVFSPYVYVTGGSFSLGAALPAGTNLLGKVGIDQTTPGSTNGVQPKQYTGTPSSFTPATTDATVFTLAAGEKGFIQNLSADAALAVKKGASASTSSFNFILAAGTATDDGKGGAIQIDDWVGVVSVAKISGTARYIAWKQAP